MRIKTLLCSAALAASSVLLAAPASAATSVDTTQPFTGAWSPFGDPDTSAYGQTFTVGADNVLDSFSLYLTGGVTNPVDFRAYIYGWDGSKATGTQLFASSLQSFTGSLYDNPTEFLFSTGGLGLTTGAQYVAFLFADFSGAESTASMPYSGSFGSEQMPGGGFVYYNAGDNFGALTSSTWNKASGDDDVWFKASFSQGDVGAVPEPATWALFLFGFFAVGGLMRSAKREQKVRVTYG